MQGIRCKSPKVDAQEFSIMDDFESFNLGLVVDFRDAGDVLGFITYILSNFVFNLVVGIEY